MYQERYTMYNYGNLAPKREIPQKKITVSKPHTNTKQAEKDRSLLRRRLTLLSITIMLFAFTMVVRSNTLLLAGNELVKLRQLEAEYTKQNDFLRLEVSRLKSPERINTFAKQALGMTIAKQNIYINKDDNKIN